MSIVKCFFMSRRFIEKWLPLFLLSFLIFFFTRPFFQPGFFSTDDGEWAIVRLAEMGRQLKDSQFPPRWSDFLNHGYGYPLFSFTYPFPYYLGIIIRIFGLGLTDSIKAVFVLSTVVSIVFMYLLGKELTGKYGGFLASVFYLTFPFRLVNLYIRGSIGEIISLSLFPALLWLTVKYIEKPDKVKLALSSLLVAILILSHNIMSFLFFPFYLIFIFFYLSYIKRNISEFIVKNFFPLVLLGLGLSAYFFIPALLEKKYIVLSQVRLADPLTHFITVDNFAQVTYGSGSPSSFSVGPIHLIAATFGLIFLIAHKANFNKYKFIAIYIVVSSLLLLFLMFKNALFFWTFPPLSWLDFPWRLLTPLGFFLSFSTIFFALSKNLKILGFFLVSVAIATSLGMVLPREHIFRPDSYYATNDATTTSADELMPIWVKDKPKNRYINKVEIEDEKAPVYNLNYNSRLIEFDLIADSKTEVYINTIYFPGWEFKANEKKLILDYDNPQGRISFQLPEGKYKISGQFKETTVRKVSDIITIFSSFILFSLLFISFVDRQKVSSNC